MAISRLFKFSAKLGVKYAVDWLDVNTLIPTQYTFSMYLNGVLKGFNLSMTSQASHCINITWKVSRPFQDVVKSRPRRGIMVLIGYMSIY